MKFPTVKNLNHFQDIIKNKTAVMFYFSNEACNVCKVLKPKVFELLQQDFPEIDFYYIDIEKLPDIAAQNSVFSIPTILVFFDGAEFIRKSRYIGIEELKQELNRPYEIMFT
ncbi:MAG TPA: thioredoxin [Bacteroidales bacterium]|nr:thioredoxin [Bacteroidales bacterium]